MLALPLLMSQACSALIAAGAVPGTRPVPAAPGGFRYHWPTGRPAVRDGHHARRVERIVGHFGDVLLLVGDRVLDVALGGDPRRQLLRAEAGREDDLRAIGDGAPCRQGDADALAERRCLLRLRAADCQGLLAQQRRIGAVLDDHARLRGRARRSARLRERRGQGERREQGRGEQAGADQGSSHHLSSIRWRRVYDASGALRPSSSTAW